MFLLTLEDAFFVRLQKGTMKFHCLLRPQRHFLELHGVDRVNLFEMSTGHSNNPLLNKVKQRENIADHYTVDITDIMFNTFCCILVCGQKIFSRGASYGTKGKI